MKNLLKIIHAEERKIAKRLLRLVLAAWASIFIVTLFLGPFNRPVATLAFGASTAFLAWLVGYDAGRRRRRFPYLKSAGLRISQSRGKSGGQWVYKTYDMSESIVEFTIDDVTRVMIKALEMIPGGKSKIQEVQSVHQEEWPGAWVFMTCDSKVRPVFVDLKGVAEMLAFVNVDIEDHEQRARIKTALSDISKNAGETWDLA